MQKNDSDAPAVVQQNFSTFSTKTPEPFLTPFIPASQLFFRSGSVIVVIVTAAAVALGHLRIWQQPSRLCSCFYLTATRLDI